jgi:serine/threonine protein kinase
MAPEQLDGREVTLWSDIYSLGLVFHEVFTGQMVLKGKTVADIRETQRQSMPTPTSTLVTILAVFGVAGWAFYVSLAGNSPFCWNVL